MSHFQFTRLKIGPFRMSAHCVSSDMCCFHHNRQQGESSKWRPVAGLRVQPKRPPKGQLCSQGSFYLTRCWCFLHPIDDIIPTIPGMHFFYLLANIILYIVKLQNNISNNHDKTYIKTYTPCMNSNIVNGNS